MAYTSSDVSLGMARTLGYGAGDFGLNLFYTGLNLYLLYYYTDVVGLSPGTAGAIFMVALLWDAVTDPVMGLLASRTQTRMGRYRPYLLIAGPALCASFVLLFAAPVIWPAQVVLACFITHMLFRTVYTVFGVPYAALSAAITIDGDARTSLSGARMQFATLGAIATAFLTPILAARLGAGDPLKGYLYTALAYAVVAEIAFLTVFSAVKERVEVERSGLSFAATLKACRKNVAFWVLFAAVVLNSVASTVFTKSIVYYARYILDDVNAIREALTTYTIAAAAAVMIWTFAARKTSKSTVLTIGLGLNAATFLAMFVLAPQNKSELLALTAIIGVGTAAAYVAFWAMLPDTVEYGQWKSGIRDEGIVFGLFQFSQKAASGLGVGAVGLLLQLFGYVPNQAQSENTLEAMMQMNFLIPAALVVVAALVLLAYPMRGRRHAAIVAELEAREATQ